MQFENARQQFINYDFDPRTGDVLDQSGGAIPRLDYTYDRLGRVATANLTPGSGSASLATLTWNDAGECTSESWSGGTLDQCSVTRGYDLLGRRTSLAAAYNGTTLAAATYGYDGASRLQSVAQAAGTYSVAASATYSYLAASPLVSQTTSPTAAPRA